MRYVCLGYLDEALWDTLPESEGTVTDEDFGEAVRASAARRSTA